MGLPPIRMSIQTKVSQPVMQINMSTSDDSLYWACFRGDKHLVLKLANPNNVNYVSPNTGDTPLHLACKLASSPGSSQLFNVAR